MYPRATVKKIVKAHSKCNVSRNVDVMVSTRSVVVSRVLTRSTIDVDLNRSSLIIYFSCKRALSQLIRATYPNEADPLICHSRLIKEATIESKQVGDRNISAKSIRKVTPVCPTKVHPISSAAYCWPIHRIHWPNSRDEKISMTVHNNPRVHSVEQNSPTKPTSVDEKSYSTSAHPRS